MEETVWEYDFEDTSEEGDIHSDFGRQELVDDDAMTPEEDAFMRGYAEDL